MKNEFNGLIKTNENCIGCNKCIRSCVCTGALVATETEDGKNFIDVDNRKCIGCGSCFDACKQNARVYTDDTDAFFADLEKGEIITLLVAPSFFSNYPDDYSSILGGLRNLGVSNVVNVGFGADITTWAYINYMLEYNFLGGISQPCPTVVNFIERYVPELIPKLFPIQSPMMCAAIYARNVMKVTEKIAFLGPCISKKEEQMSLRGKGHISYNVTYSKLMDYVKKNNISGRSGRDDIVYGMGSIFPTSGGLRENIHFYLGDDILIRREEGEYDMYNHIKFAAKNILDKNHPYLLFDFLNCTKGCCYGPGVESEEIRAESRFINLQLLKLKIKKSEQMEYARALSPEQRLRNLNEQFAELKLEDYLCTYTDYSKQTEMKIPTRYELDVIFKDMHKHTAEDREISCASCGYKTCTEMATAIHNGLNHKKNCVYYIRDEAIIERKKAMQAEIYRELAITDIQTGLRNRNAYYEWCESVKDFSNCAIITYDLNNLKRCNDTYGHAFGDKYIEEAVKVINMFFGDFGVTYRVGGDEFITVIENADISFVKRHTETLKIYLIRNQIFETNIQTGIAIGYAFYDSELDSSFTDTEKRADMAMYRDKKFIKNN